MSKSGRLKRRIAEMEEFWVKSVSQEWVAAVVIGIKNSFGGWPVRWVIHLHSGIYWDDGKIRRRWTGDKIKVPHKVSRAIFIRNESDHAIPSLRTLHIVPIVQEKR